MDQTKARKYFDYGAFLLFQNAPQNMEFGIDTNLWTIGPKFLGIKMIPPGIHLISHSTGEMSKHSFFKSFESKEVYIVKWNSQTEQLEFNNDAEEIERVRSNLFTIDPNLGAYPLENYKRWKSLSSYISNTVLDCLFPSSGHGFYQMSSSSYPDETGISESPIDPHKINFTLFNIRKSYPEGASILEISRYGVDKSWLLHNLITQKYNGDPQQLLAELQVSFLVLLYGHNFEGFEQWKRLVHLTTHSYEALLSVSTLAPAPASDNNKSQGQLLEQFFLAFIEVLKEQMDEVSKDMFQDVMASENFLCKSLSSMSQTVYFRSTGESGVVCSERIVKKWAEFELFILDKLNWDIKNLAEMEEARLDLEEGEDAPVVVEL